jgi:hypothetical protein
MRLEYSLSQSNREKISLEDALAEIRSHLDQQATIHDEISGPFSCVTIDRGGSRVIE